MSLLTRERNRTIPTPATDGKANHETLYGAMAGSIFHWKIVAFVALAIVVWDRVQFHVLLQEKQYIPVVIAEHQDGALRFVGEGDPSWKPSDRNILDPLKWTILTMRGRTLDAQFDAKLWKALFYRCTPQGQQQLATEYEKWSNLEAKGRINVTIESINKGTDGTYIVGWIEQRHTLENIPAGKPLRFQGFFQVRLETPSSLQGWHQNASGVWFDGWNIAEQKEQF